MTRSRLHFLFLNIGHFLDHLFMLVFASVAALALTREWGLSYAELIPYATPGFLAFGLLSLPAGWIADKWSREGMMAVFFIGIGLASAATALARSPLEIGIGLFVLGTFAAIYHPVGLPLVIEGRRHTGTAIAINGVWGNLGVGSAALITGALIDSAGWRAAFVAPGVASVIIGLAYLMLVRDSLGATQRASAAIARRANSDHMVLDRAMMVRIFAILVVSTALSGIVFQSATFAMPKVLDERLAQLDLSATLIGWYTFIVFALAAVAQLIAGALLDRFSERSVFMTVAAMQAVFFALMPGLTGYAALAVSIGFMLAVFGQIPINDTLLGRVTKSEWRSRVFGARYVITFTGVAAAIPFIAWVHANWGFDTLFRTLAWMAGVILLAAALLPGRIRGVAARSAEAPAE